MKKLSQLHSSYKNEKYIVDEVKDKKAIEKGLNMCKERLEAIQLLLNDLDIFYNPDLNYDMINILRNMEYDFELIFDSIIKGDFQVITETKKEFEDYKKRRKELIENIKKINNY